MNAIPRLSTLLSLCALMAACASAPPQQQPEKLFADELFRAPAVRIDAADVFALTPDMHAYLEHDVGRLVRTRGRQQGLYEALRGEVVDAANFRRDMLGTALLEDTGLQRSEGPGRPGRLYRRA